MDHPHTAAACWTEAVFLPCVEIIHPESGIGLGLGSSFWNQGLSMQGKNKKRGEGEGAPRRGMETNKV